MNQEAIDDPKEDREEKPKRKVAAGPPQGRHSAETFGESAR